MQHMDEPPNLVLHESQTQKSTCCKILGMRKRTCSRRPPEPPLRELRPLSPASWRPWYDPLIDHTCFQFCTPKFPTIRAHEARLLLEINTDGTECKFTYRGLSRCTLFKEHVFMVYNNNQYLAFMIFKVSLKVVWETTMILAVEIAEKTCIQTFKCLVQTHGSCW